MGVFTATVRKKKVTLLGVIFQAGARKAFQCLMERFCAELRDCGPAEELRMLSTKAVHRVLNKMAKTAL